MTPENEIKINTDAAPRPWVKPVIDRIPLNTAKNGLFEPKADDGTAGSS